MKNMINKFEKIEVFRGKEVRKTIYKKEWWFSILDIIKILTDSPQPKTYWDKMKERDMALSQPFPFWEQSKMILAYVEVGRNIRSVMGVRGK